MAVYAKFWTFHFYPSWPYLTPSSIQRSLLSPQYFSVYCKQNIYTVSFMKRISEIWKLIADYYMGMKENICIPVKFVWLESFLIWLLYVKDNSSKKNYFREVDNNLKEKVLIYEYSFAWNFPYNFQKKKILENYHNNYYFQEEFVIIALPVTTIFDKSLRKSN